MRARGFIVQPTYRTHRGRTVVHLYGRLESGETFLVRDGRQTPHFWVRAEDRTRAKALGAAPLAADGKVSLRGEPLLRVEAGTPQELTTARDRLHGAGVLCLEADVRFATRYLVDRGIRGSLEIDGEPRPGTSVAWIFDDPELRPSDWVPGLTLLSFDIETNPQGHVLSVALYGRGASEVWIVDPAATVGEPARAVRDERELISAFCRRVREIDPDILAGWNVIDFDLAMLARRAAARGVALELGRGEGATRVESARFRYGTSHASVPGRVVLDGIALMRGSFIKMDEYSLDAVAREVLGEGKLFHGPRRFQEIVHAYENDREQFVRYNLTDARLVVDIFDSLKLVELAVERSRLTGMTLDRVSSSIAAFDFLYLSELSRRGIVAPSVGDAAAAVEPTSGGHVLDPEPGLYRNVLIFDFKSLYPSIIRTFQIDPLGYLPDAGDVDDPIEAPNGAAFRREPGILPRILDELFPLREQAKAAGDQVRSQAVKILMNSFYGVLGTPACRFHNAEIANAITGFGREFLLWSKARFESYGHRVLYGDTDSLFVLSGADDPGAARELGVALAARLNAELAHEVMERWRVESRLELQMEKVYLRLVLPRARHVATGARKRYAGLVETKRGREVVFTGMEVVRRDWTELAKQVQRELYERLFDDRPVEEYIKQLVTDLRAGRHDASLVYRKALRKELGEYTATTPPHVVAARKLKDLDGRLISYVMTTHGPEPAPVTADIDYEHYVQKQVRPVAEPVLDLLGLNFDRLTGTRSQLGLFE